MKLPFTKMHGLGNDFIVLDGIRQSIALTTEQIQRLADRRFGIGFDQLLIVEASDRTEIDFRYRIFNASGAEVEQCGNGARCFAHFVRQQGLTSKRQIRVETNNGDIVLHVTADNLVTVDMGRPRFAPAEIPLLAPGRRAHYDITVDEQEQTLHVGAVSMGNPHVVLNVGNTDTAPVQQLGPLLEQHQRFPQGVNVGFMQVVSRNHIRLRVFERGVGETLACGSGACAAVVIGQVQDLLDAEVTVELRGGSLHIAWRGGDDDTVTMTGPANRVFTGEIEV